MISESQYMGFHYNYDFKISFLVWKKQRKIVKLLLINMIIANKISHFYANNSKVFLLFQEGGALKSGPDGKTDLAFHQFN